MSAISSYSNIYLTGFSAIFHVSRIRKDDKLLENIATLEVTKNRVLIQAKAKCTSRVSHAYMKVIRKQAQLNQIK